MRVALDPLIATKTKGTVFLVYCSQKNGHRPGVEWGRGDCFKFALFTGNLGLEGVESQAWSFHWGPWGGRCWVSTCSLGTLGWKVWNFKFAVTQLLPFPHSTQPSVFGLQLVDPQQHIFYPFLTYFLPSKKKWCVVRCFAHGRKNKNHMDRGFAL